MKTEFENSISNGIDESGRRIFFGRYLPNAEDETGNEISEITVEYAVRAIHKMVRQSSTKPIEIHMNSFGGEVYSMMYLIDVILSCPCQIKFFGGGAIMSAASIIMSVCDERYVYENSTIMLHSIDSLSGGSVLDVEIDVNETKRLQGILESLYANNSRMPKAFWREILQRNLFISPNEAVMLGLVDKIVPVKKRGNLRRVRIASLQKKTSASEMKRLVSKLCKRIKLTKTLEIKLTNPVIDEVDPSLMVTEGEENGIRKHESGSSGENVGSSERGDETTASEHRELEKEKGGRGPISKRSSSAK